MAGKEPDIDEAPLRCWRLALVPVPIVAALVIAACGSGDAAAPEAAEDDRNGAVTTTVEPTTTATSAAPMTGAPSERADRSDSASDEAAARELVAPVAYDGDFGTSIAPIFAEKCASCHAPGGPGTTRWTLATAADVTDELPSLVEAIEDRTMPPWPAGGDSPAFVGDRSLRPDQLDAVLAWVADGGPLDIDPATAIEPVAGVVGLSDPDLTLVPAEPYAGSTATRDDYRCQIYDPQLPDGGWITAYEFVPDQPQVVHHAIGYLIPADRRDRAESLDGADGRPGWSCFGSSGLGRDEIFLGWAPGQDPTRAPDGTGLWVEPGAFIVVQVHYHYEPPPQGVGAPPDRSSLAIQLSDAPGPGDPAGPLVPIEVASLVAPAEIPCSRFESGPLCDRDAAIRVARQKYGPQGVLADGILQLCRASVEDFAAMTDGVATSSCDIPAGFVGADGEVVSVLGHQHEIGSAFKMTLNPDTPDERVLLDIPDWDFDWQYRYTPVDRIVIEPDDVIRLECEWDRARRDPSLEPAYVVWADGTDDEMCFATIATRPA